MIPNGNQYPLDLSLHQSVRHWAEFQPEKPAIITDEGTVSYLQLYEHVLRLRELLQPFAGHRQSTVGLLVSDKVSFFAALCAVLAETHVPVLLNLGLQPDLLGKMIHDASCSALLSDWNTVQLNAIRGHCPSIPIISAQNSSLSIRDVEVKERYVGDTWGIIYSSGTTALPKGIVRSDLSMLTELLGWCLELPITRDGILFVGRPVFYTGGLVVAAAALLVGASVILPKEWSIETYKRLVGQYSVDLAFLIPDQVRELVAARSTDQQPWPHPRRILTMGAPITTELKQLVPERLDCDYIESWGNAEGLGTITTSSDISKRPRSIGRPFLTDRMFVVDEDGNPLPSGVVGRLAGRSDSTLSRYRNREDLDREIIRGRLVMSEDFGHTDDDGYFYIAGRLTQRIMRNGTPVFATDIENAIRGHREVRDVVVVAVPDDVEGEVPVAAIALESRGGTAAEQLLLNINGGLSDQQRLARIHLMSELPRNAAGKVDLQAVRTSVVASHLGSQQHHSSNLSRKRGSMKKALLVIDVQRIYSDATGALSCVDASSTIKRVNSLIAAAHKNGEPVICVRHIHKKNGSDTGRMFDYAGDDSGDFNFKVGSEEVEYSPALQKPSGAIELTKTRYSAFAGTKLHETLQKMKITTVVICGFMTNFCCDSTAREAHDKDYFVDFIVDATGTPGTETMNQDQIRTVVGELLSGGFAQVFTTDAYLEKLAAVKKA